MQRLYFPNVNILRGFAAVLVLVYHVIEFTKWSDFPGEGALVVFRIGWLGVDLFFVLSGFVIGLSALTLYRDRGEHFRRTFMRRRLARIAPLYVCTATLFLTLVDPQLLHVKATVLATHVAAHLAFVHNWFYATHSSIDGPNWSVAAEMQFYVLAVLLCPWLSRIEPALILLGGVGLAWTARWVGFWCTYASRDTFRSFIFTSQVPCMADEFAVGIVLARSFLDGTLARLRQRWRHGDWALTAGAVVSGALCLTIAMKLYWPHAGYWDDVYMVTLWRTTIAISFGFVVASFSLLPDLTRWRLLKPLDYLGDISYGIYLWHLLVILSLKRLLPADAHRFFLTSTLVVTVALAATSWHLLEKPMVARFR